MGLCNSDSFIDLNKNQQQNIEIFGIMSHMYQGPLLTFDTILLDNKVLEWIHDLGLIFKLAASFGTVANVVGIT